MRSSRLKLALAGGFLLLQYSGCNSSVSNGPSLDTDPNSSGSNPPSSQQPGSVAAPQGWDHVSKASKCGLLQPSVCRGLYGFTVRLDGTYVIGPTKEGEIVTGVLTPSEFQALIADLNPMAVQLNGNSPTCIDSQGNSEISDLVTLTTSDGIPHTIYEKNGVQYCFQLSDQVASQLNSDLQTLMDKYYPVPFPASSPISSRQHVSDGRWGAIHINLDVNRNGAVIELECKTGTLDQPLLLDSSNQFSVTGKIVSNTALIPGNPKEPIPATFEGKVKGNSMTLTISYIDQTGHPNIVTYYPTYGQTGEMTNFCAL